MLSLLFFFCLFSVQHWHNTFLKRMCFLYLSGGYCFGRCLTRQFVYLIHKVIIIIIFFFACHAMQLLFLKLNGPFLILLHSTALMLWLLSICWISRIFKLCLFITWNARKWFQHKKFCRFFFFLIKKNCESSGNFFF